MKKLIFVIVLLFMTFKIAKAQQEISIFFAYTRKAAQEAGGPNVLKQNAENGIKLLNGSLANTGFPQYRVR